MTTAQSLSETVRTLLAAAASATDRIILLPERLPAAAQRAVAQSMLKAGLAEEAPADDDQPAWRTTEAGKRLLLRASPAGLAAVGAGPREDGAMAPAAGDGVRTVGTHAEEPAAAAAAQAAPRIPRVRLREAAEAVLAAWDDTTPGQPALPAAFEALRAALVLSPTRPTAGIPRQPRTDTKQAAVLSLLRRPEGATVAQVAEATGWANHTVRGFFAGLKKKGIAVGVLERVRQVGPGKEGAKGSYTVYRVEGAA